MVRKRWPRQAETCNESAHVDRTLLYRTGGIVLAASVAAAVAIFVCISLRRGPLGWDEGTYVLKAYGVGQGLRHLSLGEAWQAVVTGDILYPPISALVLGPIFAVAGSSETAVFATTAAGFVAAAGLLFWTGCLLDAKTGPWTGLIGVLLFLSSPLHIQYAGTAMLEIAGTVATLLAMAAYLKHLKESSERTALATGIALAVLFFTKYNYGLMALGAVALCQLSMGRWQPWRRENLWLWVPVVALAGVWFRLEGKWDGFVGFATNRDSGLPMLSAANLLFYPRAFVLEYSSSVILGTVTLAAGLTTVIWCKRMEVRAVLLFLAVGWTLLTVHHLKADRFAVTVMPCIFLLAAFSVVQAYQRLKRPLMRHGLATFGAALFGPSVLLYTIGLPRLVSADPPRWNTVPWPHKDLSRAIDLALSEIDPSVPTTFSGITNEWSPDTIRWRFSMAHPGARLYFDYLEKGPANLVVLQVLPGSPYLNADYLAFHADNDTTRRRAEAKITGGTQFETLFPKDRLRLIVIKDGDVHQPERPLPAPSQDRLY